MRHEMNLREARFFKGYSQYDLMAKTGIHQSRISLIERGYYKPNEVEKRKLAKVLNYAIHEIFSDNGVSNNE